MIHVVIVIVRQQHDIDLRQVIEGDAGRIAAPRPCKAEWARSFREDRVGENVRSCSLDQETGMADEGYPQPFGDLLWRSILWEWRWNRFWPRLPTAQDSPAEKIA